MNNFTKEELNTIYKCIRMAEDTYGESSDLDRVLFKVKSIIDNYCKHSWQNSCCGCKMSNIYCENCDILLEDK